MIKTFVIAKFRKIFLCRRTQREPASGLPLLRFLLFCSRTTTHINIYIIKRFIINICLFIFFLL